MFVNRIDVQGEEYIPTSVSIRTFLMRNSEHVANLIAHNEYITAVNRCDFALCAGSR